MKTQLGLLSFAVLSLLAEAQIAAQLPDEILANFRFPLDNYRPLVGQLQIETVNPEDEDQSTVSVSSLTFPAQETDCSQLDTSMQGQECPLKDNGKLMNCSAKVSYTSQGGDVRGFEFSCDAAIKEAFGSPSHGDRGDSGGRWSRSIFSKLKKKLKKLKKSLKKRNYKVNYSRRW